MNTQFRKGVLEICVLTLISQKRYVWIRNSSKYIKSY